MNRAIEFSEKELKFIRLCVYEKLQQYEKPLVDIRNRLKEDDERPTPSETKAMENLSGKINLIFSIMRKTYKDTEFKLLK